MAKSPISCGILKGHIKNAIERKKKPDLVQKNGESCDECKAASNEERGTDSQSIRKVVGKVSSKIQIPRNLKDQILCVWKQQLYYQVGTSIASGTSHSFFSTAFASSLACFESADLVDLESPLAFLSFSSVIGKRFKKP